jgi:WD40 repeat protein
MSLNSEFDTNLTSLLGIKIANFSEKYIDKKTVTYYSIEITSNITKKTWKIEKRYSEFKSLHDTLNKMYPNLPSIPKATFFKVKSIEALTKRQELLEKFLRSCIQRRDILLNDNFKQFLDLYKNAPEIIGNEPKKIYDYHKLPLGVRNFLVIPSREIMLVCCSEMNIISRADSTLSNITFPWEKKKDDKVPLGAAFIYQCKPDEKEIYIIHKIWAQPFEFQTSVIYWEDRNEIYCIGNDDGKIYSFKAKPNTHYMTMNKISELNFHKNRVMGIALDPRTMNLYSCSTDKKFYITDINGGNYANTLIHSNDYGYTNLVFDSKYKRIFLSDEIGKISIYSIEGFPPVNIGNVVTSGQSCIRAMHIDLDKNYIFIGNVNGKISVLNLDLPGKEKLTTEVSCFGVGLMKIRICRNNKKNNELITGDEDGRVVIWSLKKGKPIYLWEAHKGAITQMWYEEESNLLWTGGKDRTIRVWKLPEKWVSAEVKDFDETEVSNVTAKMAEEKMEKINENNYSDDDDLNGWCFRNY